MAVRDIVSIDAEKCTGCGDCIPMCAEGAVEVVDGSAALLSDILCDGLGACLGVCPEDAITVTPREAVAFDEDAVRKHLAERVPPASDAAPAHTLPVAGCPPSVPIRLTDMRAPAPKTTPAAPSSGPTLPHWPIKLDLISPDAPFLRGADLMLVADCAPFARAELREEFTSHTAVMIGCPKSDPYQSAAARLTEILRRANARSLTVVHMEVPCCSGYWHMAQEALTAAESPLALRRMVVGVRGEASTETAS